MKKISLFLDSGAFSAFTKGVKIDIQEYIGFIKKHQKYIELREEAQSHHEKAMEMLSKIMAVKNERRKRWKESKETLKNQNLKTRNILLNKETHNIYLIK